MLPGERRLVGPPVESADEGVVAALEERELVVLRDLLREAHAAVAEDAALAVDRDQRRERDRLGEVALRLDEPAAARAPAVGDVLERALAALVADRAVERVVDEQELDHRVLRVLHAVGLRVDHHAVLDGGGAGGLELRDALDLDHAHAARAHGAAELRLVAEERHLDVAALRRVDQPLALGRAHLAAVDAEGDPCVGHRASRPRARLVRRDCAGRGQPRTTSLRDGCASLRSACWTREPAIASMCASNSGRNCGSSIPPASPSSRPARRGNCR